MNPATPTNPVATPLPFEYGIRAEQQGAWISVRDSVSSRHAQCDVELPEWALEAIAGTYRLAAARKLSRWNIEEVSGGLRICDGTHAKTEDCIFTEYVPKTELTAARAQVEEMKKDLSRAHEGLDERDELRTKVAELTAEVERLKKTHLDCIDEQAAQANIMNSLRTQLEASKKDASEQRQLATAAVKDFTDCLAQLTDERDRSEKLVEALEACSVFVTPVERLKNWNEYKEDASQRRTAALFTSRNAVEPSAGEVTP